MRAGERGGHSTPCGHAPRCGGDANCHVQQIELRGCGFDPGPVPPRGAAAGRRPPCGPFRAIPRVVSLRNRCHGNGLERGEGWAHDATVDHTGGRGRDVDREGLKREEGEEGERGHERVGGGDGSAVLREPRAAVQHSQRRTVSEVAELCIR